MPKLQVEIITPARCLLKTEADELIAPGANGLFGVRPGHAPLLAVMVPGPLIISTHDEKSIYFVTDGFVEVSTTTARVFADTAEAQAHIDVAAAHQAIVNAKSQLESAVDARRIETEKRIRIEQMRVEVAQLK